MKRLMFWFLLAVLFLPAAPSWAADGDIDTTFGTGGRVTTDFGTSYDYANARPLPSRRTARLSPQGIKGVHTTPLPEKILPLRATIRMEPLIRPSTKAAR